MESLRSKKILPHRHYQDDYLVNQHFLLGSNPSLVEDELCIMIFSRIYICIFIIALVYYIQAVIVIII